ncbi:DUF4129 domain-containing protein [Dermabacteraceae bacterium CCM 9519]
MLPFDGQFDPDGARELVEKELAAPRYRDSPNIVEEFFAAVRRYLNGLKLDEALGGNLTYLLLAVVLLCIAALVIFLFLRSGGFTTEARARKAVSLSSDSGLSALELRNQASSDLKNQAYREATLTGMRALVKDMEERTLLHVKEGTTAHEASTEIARFFPTLATQLQRAAQSFDRAAYSERPISADDATKMVQLAKYLHESQAEVKEDEQ